MRAILVVLALCAACSSVPGGPSGSSVEGPRQARGGSARNEAARNDTCDGDDLFVLRLPNGVIAEVRAGHFTIDRNGRVRFAPADPRR